MPVNFFIKTSSPYTKGKKEGQVKVRTFAMDAKTGRFVKGYSAAGYMSKIESERFVREIKSGRKPALSAVAIVKRRDVESIAKQKYNATESFKQILLDYFQPTQSQRSKLNAFFDQMDTKELMDFLEKNGGYNRTVLTTKYGINNKRIKYKAKGIMDIVFGYSDAKGNEVYSPNTKNNIVDDIIKALANYKNVSQSTLKEWGKIES